VNRAALSWLRRRREALAGLACGAGAAALGPAALTGAPVALLAALALAAASVWLVRDALTRARLAARPGPGVAAVREGRIVYFGPETGGVADLDGLVAVEINAAGDWVLRGADGAALIAPTAAEGAEALLDAFAALPGFDRGAVDRALARPGVHAIVWRRRGPPPQPRLAQPEGGA
jgi:hypothetical protein